MTSLEVRMERAPSLGEPCDPGLSFLLDIVRAEHSKDAALTDAIRDHLSALTAAWAQPSESPPDLVGRKSPCSPPEWHLQRFIELLDAPAPPDRDVDRARRRYHARWLGRLLAPERAEFRPSVTILIPVYNRVSMAVEAVESCLAQNWRPLDILVIDDGSTDDLAGAMMRFGDAVRVVRQANGGVSSARNAGIRLANGDFIHFLDSDNLLAPAAVARKLDGFARFPDAELCYSLAKVEGERHPDVPQILPPDGSANCPTTCLLASHGRYPFYISCVMLPRYTLLSTGGFEEDLRRGEDTRFWVKLAMRDTKVIGLDAQLTTRRLSRSTLSGVPMAPALQLVVQSRTIADLLGGLRGWPSAARRAPALLRILLQDGASLHATDLPHGGMSPLLAAIGRLGSGERHDGMSPLPLLAHLRHLIARATQPNPGIERETPVLLAQLGSVVDEAVQGAAPLSRLDVPFWATAQLARDGKRRVNSYFDHADLFLQDHGSALPLIDELLRSAPAIPPKHAIETYLTLRRWRQPRRIALWLALRKAT